MKRFTLMFMALIMSVLVFAQESQSVTYDFDDGTLQGWTTIDADGDGYVWENTQGKFDAQASSAGAVCSASYINDVGALNPDNYLVSPKVTLGETFSFYAVAQDANYAAEHFAVCVSTTGNTDPADFTVLQEWTLTKARGNNAVRAKVTRIPVKAPRNAPLKVQGKWYQYIVDLSDYAGKEGYVAIRHFNCTDKFYMLVDNITFGTPVEIVDEGPTLVELPEDAEVNPYMMVYTDASNNTASTPVNVAVVGTDVYFQGMSYYIPEAWVKGTMDGNVVTFPAKQYVGEYGTYGASYAFYNGDATFTYDADANTYTAEGEIYGVLGGQYYDGHYFNPILKTVVEKAAMPADPEIMELSSTNYGYIIDFNIPLVDTDGDGLVTDKLSYMIYTDIEGEIAPLTFTSATHIKLTEDMTEIPYGFTENYDFYTSYIYLNDLYDSNWNNIGIQSIYRGGDAENATEIQWYEIKPYSSAAAGFNFNEMDVATSSNSDTDAGNITEDFVLTDEASGVTLTISPKEENATTNNRFWGTNDGPQLRMYSGTMTFDAPEGAFIKELAFNHNGKWAENTVDDKVIPNDATNKIATWTGCAAQVVVSIVGNTQINSIDVVYGKPDVVVVPEGLMEQTAYLYANASEEYVKAQELALAIDIPNGEVYVQGLNNYLPEAWVKGTFDLMSMTATIPTGQYFGDYEYEGEFYPMYFVGAKVGEDGIEISDVVFTLDSMEPLQLSTDNTIVISAFADDISYYEYMYDIVITANEVELVPVEVPEGLETETYSFKADEWVYTEDDDDRVIAAPMKRKAPRKASYELQPYSAQIQVGIDGKDVYFQGFTDDTSEFWAKGTLSEDGKTVTIPANQFMGTLDAWFWTFDYFLTATDENYEFADIVLTYDPETNSFSTDQAITLHDGVFSVGQPYQEFAGCSIAKMVEVAATPADPSIVDYNLTGVYPIIYLDVPTVGTEGEELMTTKLFYTIWTEDAEGTQTQLTLTAAEYENFVYYGIDEMTEIPYTYDDSYDIYTGGEYFYLNQGADVIATWKRIGVQSIYYGLDERHESNIIWMDNPVYEEPTGINGITAENDSNVRYFDLQGRAASADAKGLLIKQVRMADGSLKTIKVIRK